jgi:hypothetical protein
VHPRRRLEPARAAHLPLFGRERLTDADVAIMLRPEFFEDPRFAEPVLRARHAWRSATIGGLYGLAGVAQAAIAKMRTGDYDKDRRLIRIRHRGRTRELPITAALAWLLDGWMFQQRPGAAGDALFPGMNGDPGECSIGQLIFQIGWRLGAQRSLCTMLLEYFNANLAKGSDTEAYYGYLGIQTERGRWSTATEYDMRALIEATDPFHGSLRMLTSPAYPAEYLTTADTELPLALHLRCPSAGGTGPLDPGHPIAVELAGMVFSPNLRVRTVQIHALFDRFLPEMDRLITEDGVTMTHLAPLFRLDHSQFCKLIKRARLRPLSVPARVVEPTPPRPPFRLTNASMSRRSPLRSGPGAASGKLPWRRSDAHS